MMHNLLIDPFIRIRTHKGEAVSLPLPGVLAALARDEIATFPGQAASNASMAHVSCATRSVGPTASR